jgi:hypothetical protein
VNAPRGSDPKLSKRVAAVPPLYRAAYVKAIEGRLSPRQAIKSKCLDCTGWQREKIRQCTARGCPLWPLRPFQTSRRRPTPPGKASPSEAFAEELARDGMEADDDLKSPEPRPKVTGRSEP